MIGTQNVYQEFCQPTASSFLKGFPRRPGRGGFAAPSVGSNRTLRRKREADTALPVTRALSGGRHPVGGAAAQQHGTAHTIAKPFGHLDSPA